MIVRALRTAEERSILEHSRSLAPFDAAQLAEHRVDLHLCAVSCTGRVEAHASLWWTDAPVYQEERVGIIGHYASTGDEAASAVLAAAIENLREQRCTIAIGPMDGNTWRRYRFVVDAGTEPPFFLEPANPPAWPLEWEQAGFAPLAQYTSALNANLSQADERMVRVGERLNDKGVRIRAAESSSLQRELSRIYSVSQIAFAKNFLYTELPERAYLAQYTRLLSKIRPELLLLAERGGDLVGFLFAIPDLAQAARGQTMDTFILKTVAILPDPSLAGLGALMAEQVQQTGRALGFSRCIHALMYEGNVSRNTSRRYAQLMRRYAIFSRSLSA
ncbi:MAG: hypothetical protein ABSD67_16565 [Terracidiphilus sp.]|jgi:GNAT superfamily N-acetyltransferase